MRLNLRSLYVCLLVAAAGAASAQTVFVYDTFTGTNNTTLQTHTPDIGGAWTHASGFGNLTIQSNAIGASGNNGADLYTNGTLASSANYVVGVTVTFPNPSGNNYFNLLGRSDATGQNAYVARLRGNGTLTVAPIVGGIEQTAIINTLTSVPADTPHLWILQMIGNQISASIDGTMYGPATDNTITTAGRVGFGLNTVSNGTTADEFYASTLSPTAVRMRTVTARRSEGRALLEWTTGREVDNLGFRIWRQDGARRTRVTPSLLAGSAFLAVATLSAGNTYRWLDTKATPRSRYWIESVATDGRSEWSGPIVPRPVPSDAAFDESQVRTSLLRDLGQRLTPVQPRARLTIAANDVRRAVAPPDTLTKQQELAAGAAVKISVDTDGWYRVTRDALLGAGLDPSTDPHRLHLYADAREVAMTVEGEPAGRIDAIRFYGTALDTPSTSTRVYWLVPEAGTARRIETGPAATSDSATASSFLVTAERRDKTVFFAALMNGENESFFGPIITDDMASPAVQTLRVPHIDRTASTAEVEIALQGGGDVTTDPQHIVGVTLNGQTLDDIRFRGRDAVSIHRNVPVALLADGDNTFTFAAKNGEGDISLVSYVRVTYAHTYDLDDGALTLTSGGGATTVHGAVLHALDVTAPASPVELPVTIENGVTHFTAATGARRTIVVTSQFATPLHVEANVPSSLHTAARADLLIIAHRSLLPAVEPLRKLRASQGLSVLVTSTEDIYDEYGYGAKDPAVLRTYLAAAKPRNVLLVGDASLDPRNYLGYGDGDLVPTKLIVTSTMKTASDSWLVDFNDDSLADLAIGRLPARTPAEAQLEIGKIVAYDSTPAADWMQSALLVTDDDPALGFDALGAQVRSYTTETISVAASGETAARQELLSRFDRGTLLVDYLGHGSIDVWTSHGLFSGADASALHNGNRLPFVVAMTCLNGYFHDVESTSLAEALLAAPDGGAVGVFASTSLTEAHSQSAANQELVRALLVDHATLGEAMLAAQRHATDANVRRTFLLFGDPSMRLRH